MNCALFYQAHRAESLPNLPPNQPWKLCSSGTHSLTFPRNALHGYVVVWNSARPVRMKNIVQFVSRREHRCRPHQRRVEHTAGTTIRFPQSALVMHSLNPYSTSTAHHKEYSHHTSPPSYSVTSGFITKVPRVCEALVDVCGLSVRARAGASSTGPLNFAMYPERAVGLIFIPFSASS